MRKNEYNSLDEFVSEYQGERDPANNKWLGLEFKYQDEYFRLSTDAPTNLENVETAFCLYQILVNGPHYIIDNDGYKLLGEFEHLSELLDSRLIKKRAFRDIIMDDDTEILGKD